MAYIHRSSGTSLPLFSTTRVVFVNNDSTAGIIHPLLRISFKSFCIIAFFPGRPRRVVVLGGATITAD